MRVSDLIKEDSFNRTSNFIKENIYEMRIYYMSIDFEEKNKEAVNLVPGNPVYTDVPEYRYRCKICEINFKEDPFEHIAKIHNIAQKK